MTRACLDTDALTPRATDALIAVDKSLIGTPDYMGVAYFWHHDYRHTMRETSYAVRRRVHGKMLKEGLDVSGSSPAHFAIIATYVRS